MDIFTSESKEAWRLALYKLDPLCFTVSRTADETGDLDEPTWTFVALDAFPEDRQVRYRSPPPYVRKCCGDRSDVCTVVQPACLFKVRYVSLLQLKGSSQISFALGDGIASTTNPLAEWRECGHPSSFYDHGCQL